MNLHPKVSAFLVKSSKLKWAIALSGGADSVCALKVLCQEWPDKVLNGSIIALHFNHNMRGAESMEDELFCRDVCRKLGVEFFSDCSSVTLHSEEDARNARFAFFSRVQCNTSFKVLITGHHIMDLAETMIMRLLRGSGTSGLAAPRPIHAHKEFTIVRPLLHMRKEEITDYLEEQELTWRTDSSNLRDDYMRNKVRHNILPLLLSFDNRDVLKAMSGGRELLEEDDDALTQLANQAYVTQNTELYLKPISNLPIALKRRILQKWLNETNISLSKKGFDDLLNNVFAKKYHKASHKFGYIVSKQGWLKRISTKS